MVRPPTFAPMLAAAGRPRTGRDHVLEPKWDGVRALVTVHSGTTTIRSRNVRDVTDCYPELHRLPASVAGRSAVFDGEIVALNDSGLSDFQRLQQRMNRRRPSATVVATVPVVYVVFDLLWLDGTDLTAHPLHERRTTLEQLELDHRWQLTPRFSEPLTAELIDTLRDVGLEGVVVKTADSIYRPGTRSTDWVKVKARRRHLAVIGGKIADGTRSAVGSLAVGMHTDDGFRYVGQVGISLPHRDARQLRQFLTTIEVDESPFVDLESRRLSYVDPLVVVDVEYTEVTASGTFRQPVLKRVVTDVDPATVVADATFAAAFSNRSRVKVGAGQRL